MKMPRPNNSGPHRIVRGAGGDAEGGVDGSRAEPRVPVPRLTKCKAGDTAQLAREIRLM
jgi:hypothetical protein